MLNRAWLVLLLAATAAVNAAETETIDVGESLDSQTVTKSGNWVDESHAFATDRAQALTEWMDDFFGDPNYDLDRAESQVRIQWRNSWNEEDDYKTKLRLRGKLQLPKISQRLNLVFNGEDGDDIVTDERTEDSAGLLYNVDEHSGSRLDLTLTASSSSLRPGIRYRVKGQIFPDDDYFYRYTQRVEWEKDEGFYTTGQLNLDYALSSSRLARWSNRVVYGEETEGAEWRSAISLSKRRKSRLNGNQRVVSYFAAIDGYTDPELIENYTVGVVFRRQIYRKFFFIELEPSYMFRKRFEDDDREGLWNVVLRFEIALEKDLRTD